MDNLDLGGAVLKESDSVVAGSYASIRFTCTAGHRIDDTAYIKIAFRQMGDLGAPQFDDPQAPNFSRIRATAGRRLVPRWADKGHTRPWSRALFLKVSDGYVSHGDQMVITFGDRTEGQPKVFRCEEVVWTTSV